jgi:RND family efflux transporter MFP subunit
MGQELARIDPQEYEARLRQTLQQADASKAQVDIAQRQLDNNRSLVDQGFISKTALDTSIANLNAAAATYQAAVATVDIARKSLNDTVLKAPISGLVSQRFAQPGERVAMDGRILEILDLSSLEVEAPLSPGDALGVRIGQIARLQVEGLPEPVQAKVTRINPSTQAGSRSVLVYLKLESNIGPQEGLRQGLYVEGTVGATTQTTLAVPVEAVRTDKPAPYLQILEPLPTADTYRVKHLNVQLGERGQLLSQAHTPLKPTGLGWMVGVGESSASAPAAGPAGLTLQGQLALAGSAGLLREGTLVHLNR